MRIIEVTGEPILHGGQERFISTLVDNINDSSMTIDVLTPYHVDNASFCETIKTHGGNVYALDMEFQPGNSRRQIFQPIYSFLQPGNYDIAHIHSGSISVMAYAAKAAKKAGIQRIIVHSHATASDSLKHSLVRAFFSPAIRKNATDFWACSKDAGIDKFGRTIADKELLIIPNGIRIERFVRDDARRAGMRETLGLCEDSYVIGHVGRFSYEKNHEFLVEVFAKAGESIADCRLLLVGEGELMQEVRKQVLEKGLQDKVVFTGPVDRPEDYYQAMDVFLFPSRWEGFGYAVLEAQAAGLPCLISAEVPADVAVGKRVEMLPLENRQLWTEKTIAYHHAGYDDNTELIRSAGYDIVSTINLVREQYREIKEIRK